MWHLTLYVRPEDLGSLHANEFPALDRTVGIVRSALPEIFESVIAEHDLQDFCAGVDVTPYNVGGEVQEPCVLRIGTACPSGVLHDRRAELLRIGVEKQLATLQSREKLLKLVLGAPTPYSQEGRTTSRKFPAGSVGFTLL